MPYSPPCGAVGFCRTCGKKHPLSKHGRCDSCIQKARILGGANGGRPPRGKPVKPVKRKRKHGPVRFLNRLARAENAYDMVALDRKTEKERAKRSAHVPPA